ncbi:MAG: hypothetical protein HY286_20060 [Planctomycetes bacterium]|nr:hypothetical protein [Planctomycetota bacterium]
MYRIAIAGAVLGGSLLAFSGITLGHGGTYRGPGDTVPPSSGGPSTPGGPKPTGPTTPSGGGPGGPNTPAPTGPVTPPAGGTPTPSGGGGPVTGANMGPDLTSWTFWWGFNREKYLNLKAHIAKSSDVITGGDDEGLVGGKAGRTSMRPSIDQVLREAVPVLKEALEKETNRDIVTGSLIALAKIGQEPQQMVDIFKKFLSNDVQEISETACLVFGILAAPEGVPVLIDFFEDSEGARKIVGKREVPYRTRTFAAYGLGLVGARTPDSDVRTKVQGTLIKFLEGEGGKRTAQKDLRVASIIALGLVKDPERKAVAVLQKYFDDNRKREEIICAHIPNAIARLLADAPPNERGAYVQQLIAELAEKGRSGDKYMRQSMAQAIGMLTHADDPFAKKAFEVLQDKIENEVQKNNLLAYFGMIALGQMAGTTNPGNEYEKFLLAKAQVTGGRVMTRAWAAMALGIEGFDQMNRKEQVTPNPEIGKALVGMMTEIKDPEQLGAYGIAIGLLRYTEGKEQLIRLLDTVKVDEYRGYFATGLGLMGETSAIGKIQDLVKSSTRRPELLRECAIGLGLLGDKSVVPSLLKIMSDKENKTLAVQAAVATALGFVGDYRAIENKDSKELTLPRMLRDKDLTAESRAFAAVALGLVCDKEELPWNFKISTDLNYTAVTETLNDQGSQTGILNIL